MILAIDQGTTGSTCLVVDDAGAVRAKAYSEFSQHFPRPGWVEHDPTEIWHTTLAVARQAIENSGISASELEAVGITNQRETVVVWDRVTGEPLYNAIVWQDRRTAQRCDQLREAGHGQTVHDLTGLVLDPYFSATKIDWLLQHGGFDRSVACFGTVDAWLIFKLTGRFVTDQTNASRTMLYDIDRLEWSEQLCDLFGVQVDSLPSVQPSASIFGMTNADLFGVEVPVAGVAGDQQAALFGQACNRAGMAKNTYGTGAFLLVNAGTERPAMSSAVLTTLAASGQPGAPDYAVESSIFVAGAAIQWLRDGLGIIESADQTGQLAASIDSNDGVYFVPALTGLGAPHWDPDVRGMITGLTRGTTRAHLVRAALEAIAYQTVDALEASVAAGCIRPPELRVDGGATANSWLMQFQADMLQMPVCVASVAETTALGAAFLAGVGIGKWAPDDVDALWRSDRTFEPAIDPDLRSELIAGWRSSVRAAIERG